MSPRALWWACACWSVAALWPAALRADPFHHQPIPLGERALGMGGAFTGVANEPSAAYYNPAGLARLEDTTLSAGLTLTAFNRLTIDDGYRTSAGRTDLTHDSSPSLPLFVSFVKQVGVRDVEQRRRHAVALSTFTVDQRQLSFDVKIENPDVAGRTVIDTLYVNHDESTRWQGISYAYRISDALSVGISAFLSLSRMAHAEERLNLTLGQANADGTSQQPTVRLDSRRASSTVTNLVARLGLLYVRPRVRAGMMIQLPSGRIKGVAKVRDRAVTANALAVDPYGTYSEESSNNLRSQEPSPWELRIGTSYEPTGDLTLALDASLYGRNGDRKHPIIAVGPRPLDDDGGRGARAGDLVVETWYRTMTANVSLGTEYTIWDAVVVRGGVFTDLSAAPSLPKTSLRYRPTDIDRFGAALSFGLVTRGYDVSLGAVGRFGIGDALAFAVDTGGAPYVRTKAREHTLYIFLTGARRAVSKLAKETVDKLREVRAAGLETTTPGSVPTEPAATPRDEPPAKSDKPER